MADSICEALDELTLDFFDKFEHLQTKREELYKIMRDGYLNLSQARYSMGNKSVCSLQYSETMNATTLAEIDGDNFEIVKHNPKTNQEEKNEEAASTLRKRKGNKDPGSGGVDETVEDLAVENNQKMKDKRLTENPLNWFGVLVPMCLRTGQAQFKTAIDLCCELVNLQNEIKILIEKYQTQKEFKMKQSVKT